LCASRYSLVYRIEHFLTSGGGTENVAGLGANLGCVNGICKLHGRVDLHGLANLSI
jgi:hypothetical protein